MELVSIGVSRKNLPEHTDEQYREWLMFQIGERGGISLDNPLSDIDLEAELRSFE